MFLLCLFSGNPACAAPKTVLVLGDSLSAGYGLEKGSGWVDLLEKRLKKDYPETAVVNASISGDTSGGGKARLPALLKRYAPSVVVIELGANDGLRGFSVKSLYTYIEGGIFKDFGIDNFFLRRQVSMRQRKKDQSTQRTC